MAGAALRELRLDEILWIPTGAPGYRDAPLAPAADRLSMLKLALAGEPRYRIDIRELAPGATGYTVDTLGSLRAEIGSTDSLYLLMGADQYAAFATWRRPEEVKKLARLAVFARPGFKLAGKDAETVPMKPLPISASDIRARVARGGTIAGLVPEPVRKYIMEHKLYH
jgi:nicotinate-nucleotide adenylyltransferase